MASGSSWTKGLAWLVVLAVVGGGGYWAYLHFSSNATTAKAQVKAAPIPVTTALVRKADFPVYLTGLGTVEPYDTVTVNSRVDGEITKVFFRQGQMVKEGDTLATIDPRPYQAALDQAQAKKAADEATLEERRRSTSRATKPSAKKNSPRSSRSTPSRRASINCKRRSKATRRRSTTPRRKSPTRRSKRRSRARPASASSTPAISSTPAAPPASSPSSSCSRSRWCSPRRKRTCRASTTRSQRDRVPVEASSSDGKTLLSKGHLSLVNNAVDQASGDIRMKARFDN